MNKRSVIALGVLVIVLIAGSFVGANDTYTYSGKWYGFVTDSMDYARGHSITPEEVRKAVTEKKARYVLVNAVFWSQRFIALEPQEKAAQFAGRQVFVYGSISTNSLTKATSYLADSDSGSGSAAASGAPAGPRAWLINITSIEPHVDDSLYR